MPTYKVLAASYIHDLLYPASTPAAEVFVEYDGCPGSNLEPIDDEGRARQAAYFADKGQTVQEAADRRHVSISGGDALQRIGIEAMAVPPPASAVVHHVPIPAGWTKLDTGRTVALAARLGAPPETTTRPAAAAFIRAELARRAGN